MIRAIKSRMGHYRVKMLDVIPDCKIKGCEEPCRPLTNRPGKFFTLCLEHQRERDRQYSKAYIERNPGRFRTNQKRYKDSPKGKATEKALYVENKDEHRVKGQQWKAENPDRTKEINNASYHRNKQAWNQTRKAYMKTEQGRANQIATQNRRRERLAQTAPGDDLSREYTKILRNDPCAYCGTKENITIDHIVAVNNGGDGSWMNLTAACNKCNPSKSDKPLLGWLQFQ